MICVLFLSSSKPHERTPYKHLRKESFYLSCPHLRILSIESVHVSCSNFELKKNISEVAPSVNFELYERISLHLIVKIEQLPLYEKTENEIDQLESFEFCNQS